MTDRSVIYIYEVKYIISMKTTSIEPKKISSSETNIFMILLMIGTTGSLLQISGGNWDITSHLMQTPESFFTYSHLLLYSGIGLLVLTTGFSFILYLKKTTISKNRIFLTCLKLFIIGSLMCVIAGPSDYLWHEAFGVDGLLSPTHFLLITGMFINSLSVVIGLLFGNFDKKIEVLRKLVLLFSLAGLWLSIIGYVYLFTLPFSNGENFNFNPDSNIAALLVTITIPLINSAIFFTSSMTIGKFGAGTFVTSIVLIINTVTNIIPTENLLTTSLWWYLPIGILPALLADIFIYYYKKYKISVENKTLMLMLVGILIGSSFYLFNFPKIVWVYAIPLNMETLVNNSSGLLMSELYQNFIATLSLTAIISIIPGAVMGMIGIFIAKSMISKIGIYQTSAPVMPVIVSKNQHINNTT